jgi:integrase
MTLTEFFESWYVPVILVGERGASESTIYEYRRSLRWWAQLTGDPPLEVIDEYTVANFASGIRAAQYTRGLSGAPRQLTGWTAAKHCRHIRYVLDRCGPTRDPSRPSKAILSIVPRVPVRHPRSGKPKPCFAWDMARQIVAARFAVADPQLPGVSPATWWLACFALLFYTGLRIGTILKLEWAWIVERADGPWLEVPEDAVPKTHKATTKPLHHLAWQAVSAIRSDDPHLVPWPHCYEHFSRLHEAIQRAAGANSTLSPQAWRRTHAAELARLGARFGLQLAQRSLDHASEKTTSGFYVDVDAHLLRKLPPLWDALEDTRQRRLFE